MARDTSSRKPPASKVSIAACVVPPGEVTRRRSSAGGLVVLDQHAGGAEDGLLYQRARGLGGQAFGFARGLHRFGQQEHIGRAAAGYRGHRVHARFVVDPHGLAGGVEQARRPAPRCVASTRSLANMPVTPAPSNAGVLGIVRTTAILPPSQRSSCAAVMPAAIDTISGRVRLRHAGQRFADGAHHLWLHRQHPGRRVGSRVDVVGEDLYAEIAQQAPRAAP